MHPMMCGWHDCAPAARANAAAAHPTEKSYPFEIKLVLPSQKQWCVDAPLFGGSSAVTTALALRCRARPLNCDSRCTSFAAALGSGAAVARTSRGVTGVVAAWSAGVGQVRGPKKHLKRLNAPKHWMLDKLGGIWAPKPSAGPHKVRCVHVAAGRGAAVRAAPCPASLCSGRRCLPRCTRVALLLLLYRRCLASWWRVGGAA
jgi:hypothetical protein